MYNLKFMCKIVWKIVLFRTVLAVLHTMKIWFKQKKRVCIPFQVQEYEEFVNRLGIWMGFKTVCLYNNRRFVVVRLNILSGLFVKDEKVEVRLFVKVYNNVLEEDDVDMVCLEYWQHIENRLLTCYFPKIDQMFFNNFIIYVFQSIPISGRPAKFFACAQICRFKVLYHLRLNSTKQRKILLKLTKNRIKNQKN